MYVSNRMTVGSVVTVVVFFATLGFTSQGSTDNLGTDLLLAALASTTILLYFMLVGHMAKKQKRVSEKLMEPGEVEVVRTRQHRFVLSLSIVSLVISLAGIIVTIWLLAVFPAVEFQTPPLQGVPGHEKSSTITIQIWWLGLVILALPFGYFAIYVWQDWKHRFYIVTNQRLIRYREIAPWLPWMGREVNQTPYMQIVDIDEETRGLGNMLDWGDVIVTVRLQESSDSKERLVMSFVPNHQAFASTLRGTVKRWYGDPDKEETINRYHGEAASSSQPRRLRPSDNTEVLPPSPVDPDAT